MTIRPPPPAIGPVPTILPQPDRTARAVGRLRPPLPRSAGPHRDLRRPREPRRDAVATSYGAVAAAPRPDREEAAVPRRARIDGMVDRDARLPVPLHLLPELGGGPGAAARGSTSRCADVARGRRPRGARPRRRRGGLHVRRADGVPGVRARHRRGWRARPACATCGSPTATPRPRPSSLLAAVIDAANVDLKAFDDRFYRRLCGARLAHGAGGHRGAPARRACGSRSRRS